MTAVRPDSSGAPETFGAPELPEEQEPKMSPDAQEPPLPRKGQEPPVSSSPAKSPVPSGVSCASARPSTPPALPPVGTRLRLGPAVTLTPLPFGGAVLASGRTLAVAECGEGDAAVIGRLLGVGTPPPEAGAGVARFTAQMLEAGWLVADRSA
ncbi:actinodefensin-associated protein B [Streptomyces sp. NPDC088400]|uniref:actinodefensin-associated protein B n=1 Tax=Streptomyces sp. NPDC088400 TaxID=3365861 RepID=UPI0037F5288A